MQSPSKPKHSKQYSITGPQHTIKSEKAARTILRDQVCNYFIEAINSGQLSADSLLPPTRVLATQMSVSRDTVVRAYCELKRMGYIECSSTRGFRVRRRQVALLHSLCTDDNRASQPIILSNYGLSVKRESTPYAITSAVRCFNYGGPPAELLPVHKWKTTMQFFAGELNRYPHQPELLGRHELRRAIAAYLSRSKQINCSQNEVIIFSSSFSAVNLLCRLLLNPGDCIAVEDPGFGGIKNIASSQYLEVFPVGVDAEGIKVRDLEDCPKRIRLIYITPTHQEPTGVSLSPTRRKELLSWAQANDAWIIEDDFDGYFQYGPNIQPAVKALDNSFRVIYLATFWKILYPITSLGFCVLPPQLVPLISKTKADVEGISDTLSQLSLATLFDQGYLERYIRKLQAAYSQKKEITIKALRQAFRSAVQFTTTTSGTQMMITLPSFNEESIIQAAQETDFPLISTASYFIDRRKNGSFLIDFTVMKESECLKKCSQFKSHLERLEGL